MTRRLALSVAALAAALGVAVAPSGAAAQSLAREAGPGGTVARHAETGKVRFVGTAPGRPIPRQAGVSRSAGPQAAARAFVRAHEGELGTDERTLTVTEVRRPGGKQESVRFQQRHRGVPVIGGELVVNLDADGNVLSAGGEVVPSPSLSTDPDVTAAVAQTTARQLVTKERGIHAARLKISEPELSIFDNRLLGGPGAGEPVLVWRMEVTGPERGEPIRELVLVNARTGSVELNFDQITDAKSRKICNANNTSAQLPCTSPVRTEGQAAAGDSDIDLAYDYSGDTYDYMLSKLGRDSLDGNGMAMVSTVKYCDPAQPCPLENAFWNGQQMAYGQGYASADDVVGHEFAHGLTEFTAGLFYYYQSGAINESLSDVFGELVDLGNGKGGDTADVRWKMGEDLPAATGIIRDMKEPGTFNDPDRMLSPNYWTSEGDSGGVHHNSGVNNKATFLMVDGGTFNGRSVTGIGGDKVAKIYYEAMTTMMTSGSDYADLFNYLPQACKNLIGRPGTSMTAANCVEVTDAVTATEMHQQPTGAPTPQAPECAPGQTPKRVYEQTFDGALDWPVTIHQGASTWSLQDQYATSGKNGIYSTDPATTNDSSASMDVAVKVPAKGYLHFQHSYDFESGTTSRWDGSVLEYTVDNGTTWTDAGPLLTAGGYNGTLASGNPLAGRQAFTSRSHGFGASRADLSTLAGKSVKFRFRMASDSSTGDMGWIIDDVRIGSCQVPAPAGGKGSSAAPTAKGDFNGDGIGDVAIGIPGDNTSAGGVQVLYGTSTGLSAGKSQLWSQSSTGIADAPEAGDGFGASLAVGDFNADGEADLAIGVPGENSRGGAVHVLHGSNPNGLTATNSQFWHQNSTGMPDAQGAGDEFGSALAAANLGGTTHADLAIGTPGEDNGAGKVHVLYGSASRLTTTGTEEWSEASTGIASTPAAGERFGASLAAADLGGTTVGDLAIGAPGTLSGAGAVHALYGAASGGLSATGSQYWSQASTNVPDTQEAGDEFGAALAAVDLGRTAQADLAVGAPGENGGQGTVHVLYGAASALATTGTQQWSQNSTNVFDTAEANDRFGAALAAADLGKTAQGDLAIGAPGENNDGGAVHVLYGSAASGVSASGSQYWSQNSSGIADLQGAGDDFGASLAALNLGKSAQSDLVVGTPGENDDTGQIHVIYGTATGLAAAESQVWTQNSAGLAGTALAGDRFGAGLGN